MKKTLSLLLLLVALTAQSQTIKQIDSLNTQICTSLESMKSLDEPQLMEALQKHMPGFYKRFKIDTAAKSDSLMDLMYFRMQKTCNTFIVLLSKMEENKSDWAIAAAKPKTELSDSDSKAFFAAKSLRYKEYDGKIVRVTLDQTNWTEKFEDGSFSKLELKKTSASTFVLKFIESNNEMRKSFSVRGEEFNYGIYGKEKNYYLAWVLTKEGKYYTFKLYGD